MDCSVLWNSNNSDTNRCCDKVVSLKCSTWTHQRRSHPQGRRACPPHWQAEPCCQTGTERKIMVKIRNEEIKIVGEKIMIGGKIKMGKWENNDRKITMEKLQWGIYDSMGILRLENNEDELTTIRKKYDGESRGMWKWGTWDNPNARGVATVT